MPRWRQRERTKTTAAALVLCLNIGVDPPDAVRVPPCARLECWVDPGSMAPPKALETVGQALQAQYERWQPRARYRLHLDPTTDDVRKLASSARRAARGERVLFHYNGHGVPRPTPNGEVWVFNRAYTQYIPLSVYDLQAWVGSPAVYVLDCSGAGLVAASARAFAEQRAAEAASAVAAAVGGPGAADAATASAVAAGLRDDVILLAACGAHETLPSSPDLPADVFTACLTTPIKVALRWAASRSPLGPEGLTADLADRVPGKQTDRKTPLGELNWVFTAVTDTIAWNCLPRALFQRLFRQDLLVASLCRNFLLAERVMRREGCTPRAWPPLPPTHAHPLWAAWDAAAEAVLLQLPGLLAGATGGAASEAAAVAAVGAVAAHAASAVAAAASPSPAPPLGPAGIAATAPPGPTATFRPSPFFADQLTAFELWLATGAARTAAAAAANAGGAKGALSTTSTTPRPPEQLPIVLQVLLSQVHRVRALALLARFLDAGAGAVDLALSVGIFPYVLKLLQTTAPDLRPALSFIWARVLALDPACQADLAKDGGHIYFVRHLDAPGGPAVNGGVPPPPQARQQWLPPASGPLPGASPPRGPPQPLPQQPAWAAGSPFYGAPPPPAVFAGTPLPPPPVAPPPLDAGLGGWWGAGGAVSSGPFHPSLHHPSPPPPGPPTPASRAHAAFVLAAVCDKHPRGQAACAGAGLLDILCRRLVAAAAAGPPPCPPPPGATPPCGAVCGRPDPPPGADPGGEAAGGALLTQWLALGLGALVDGAPELGAAAAARGAPDALARLLGSGDPEVRAAALFALGRLICVPQPQQQLGGGGGASSAGGTPAPGASAGDPHPPPPPPHEEQQGVPASAASADVPSAPPPPLLHHLPSPPPLQPPPPLVVDPAAAAAVERAAGAAALRAARDASPLVRAELAAVLARLALAHGREFGDAVMDAAAGRGLAGAIVGTVPLLPGPAGQASMQPASAAVSALPSPAAPAGSSPPGPGGWTGTVSPDGADLPGPGDDEGADLLLGRGGGAHPTHPAPGVRLLSAAAADPAALYARVLAALLSLAADPAPGVATVGAAALAAAGVEVEPVPGAMGVPGAGGGGPLGARGSAGSLVGSATGPSSSRPPPSPGGFGGPASSGGGAGIAAGTSGASPAPPTSRWNPRAWRAAISGQAAAGGGAGGGGGGGLPANPGAPHSDGSGSGRGRSSTIALSMPATPVGSPPAGVRRATPATAWPPFILRGGAGGGKSGGEEEEEEDEGRPARTRRARPTTHGDPSLAPPSAAWAAARARFCAPMLPPAPPVAPAAAAAATAWAVAPPRPGAPRDAALTAARRRDRGAAAIGLAARFAAGGRITDALASIETGATATAALALHPFRPSIAAADTAGIVRVYALSSFSSHRGEEVGAAAPPPQAGRCTNAFDLAGPAVAVAGGRQPTPRLPPPGPPCLFILNETHASLLAACGSDGGVRVWRDWSFRGAHRLATAWQAVPLEGPAGRRWGGGGCGGGGGSAAAAAPLPTTALSCYCLAPGPGALAAAGGADPGLVHVWSLETERRAAVLVASPAGGPGVSRLACAPPSSSSSRLLLAAARTDGVVTLLDGRVPGSTGPVASLRPHEAGCVLVGLVPGPGGGGGGGGSGGHRLVTAAASGELAFSDWRGASGGALTSSTAAGVVKVVTAHASGGLTALASHPRAPLLATGTAAAVVKLWSGEGEAAGPAVRAHGPLLGARVGPVDTLAFHPYRGLLASAGRDPFVAVFSLSGR